MMYPCFTPGKRLETPVLKCEYCGNRNLAGDRCPTCGAPTPKVDIQRIAVMGASLMELTFLRKP